MVAGSALAKLQATAGAAWVQRYFDRPSTTLIVGTRLPAAYAGWHVRFAFDVRSVGQLRAGLSRGLPPQVSEVLFDPEHWSFTPTSEQLAVAQATAQVAAIARAAGLGLIVAPSTDLAEVVDPGQRVAPAFLASGILAGVAASASSVEVQAQGLESDPTRYAAYVRSAAGQVHSANPAASVLAGLSTNPSGQSVTPAELLEAVALTRSVVAGYWLNVPSGGAACPRCGTAQPQVATELVDLLARQGSS